VSWQLVQQRRQKRPVGWLEPGSVCSQLALQDHDLVAQGEDLNVLVVVACRQQAEHREGVRDAEVCQL
jgi:hypothetical protein